MLQHTHFKDLLDSRRLSTLGVIATTIIGRMTR